MPDSMIGAWQYSLLEPFRYGDDVSYKKGVAFLDGLGAIEDWGCGFAHARAFVVSGPYVGLDGSSPAADKIVDLRHYRSETDCILMRHVLEHNCDWQQVLSNAVLSFRRRMSLILFTPFAPSTHAIAWSTVHTTFPVPDISFKKSELTAMFSECTYFEESVATSTQYGIEHIFYIEKQTFDVDTRATRQV